jgi:hypothetical protein
MANEFDDLDWAPQDVANRPNATDKEKLLLKIRLTIEWEFGQICDLERERLVAAGHSEDTIGKAVSLIRTHGNNAIRVIENHMNGYSVARKHAHDTPNKARILKNARI